MHAPKITPEWVIRTLRNGGIVDLEAPGWQDTVSKVCPECGRLCKTFKAAPDVLFLYGHDYARRHECQRVLPLEDSGSDSKSIRADEEQRRLHDISRAFDHDRVMDRRRKDG